MFSLAARLLPPTVTKERWRTWLSRDRLFGPMLKSLEGGDAAADDWIVEEGVLVRRVDGILVLPEDGLPFILRAAHDSAGHFGFSKTFLRVRRDFWRPGLSVAVRAWVRHCAICVSMKLQRRTGELDVGRDATTPFEEISIDLLLGFPRSRAGNDAVLVILDLFSRLLLLEPCSASMTAKDIASILSDRVLRLGWRPRRLIPDSEARLTGAVMSHLAASLQAELQPSLPHHHCRGGAFDRLGTSVWAHFNAPVDDKAQCKYCSTKITSKDDHSIGTSPLLRHYERKHKAEPSQPKLSFTAFDPEKALIKPHEFILGDQQAFTVTESAPFIAFVQALRPGFQLPSADTVRRQLLQTEKHREHQLKRHSSTIDSQLSITTDGWSVPNGDHYLGVTAHWIDQDFKPEAVLIGFLLFHSPHTAANALELIWNLLGRWGLREQLVVEDGLKDARVKLAIERVCALSTKHTSLLPCKLLWRLHARGGSLSTDVPCSLPRHGSAAELDVYDDRSLAPYTTSDHVPPRLQQSNRDFKELAFPHSVWDEFDELVTVLRPFQLSTDWLQGQRYQALSKLLQMHDVLVT
ncbi:hypothetical protein A4X03_0g4498 [Tilletia caries]|uniref:Integrase catalytic domain-containing protein n=1 Tax=Tilletia caries TaxID=13290 RepID=A0A8T8TC97_9BASI|nr:hypothetical protein A4X03_0g4498 [Tilletia caries]